MSKTLVGGGIPKKKKEDKNKPFSRLPKPDQFGNYWLGLLENGDVDTKNGPAIFPSKRVEGEDSARKILTNKNFILFGGKIRGFIFEGGKLLRFDTAEEAYDELKRLGLVEEPL